MLEVLEMACIINGVIDHDSEVRLCPGCLNFGLGGISISSSGVEWGIFVTEIDDRTGCWRQILIARRAAVNMRGGWHTSDDASSGNLGIGSPLDLCQEMKCFWYTRSAAIGGHGYVHCFQLCRGIESDKSNTVLVQRRRGLRPASSCFEDEEPKRREPRKVADVIYYAHGKR